MPRWCSAVFSESPTLMDRARIKAEVIEILANKLHKLPPPPTVQHPDDEDFDYEAQTLRPEITDNHLDVAEVAMDLEDAFGFNFDDRLPGDQDLETIGKIIDYIQERVERRSKAKAAG